MGAPYCSEVNCPEPYYPCNLLLCACRAESLRKLLSGLGPSFVKIGQALSARPDLLPQPYLESLSQLQDRLPSFPNEIAFAVMEEELGLPVAEVFAELSEQPVAAASLGQVRGKTRVTVRLFTGNLLLEKPFWGHVGAWVAFGAGEAFGELNSLWQLQAWDR